MSFDTKRIAAMAFVMGLCSFMADELVGPQAGTVIIIGMALGAIANSFIRAMWPVAGDEP